MVPDPIFFLHLFLLFLFIDLGRGDASAALYWSFCYYGSNTGWSVSISGSLLTLPLNSSTPIPTYPIINAMGVRTEFDANGNVVSSVNVIGVAPVGVTASLNDNLLQTQWPVLDAFGVAFILQDNVTIPRTSPPYNTSLLAISGEPPVEFPDKATTNTFSSAQPIPPIHSISSTTNARRAMVLALGPLSTLSPILLFLLAVVTFDSVSYFMYQTGNTASALQCPAPPPTQLVYYYTASDKHTRDPYSFAAGKSVWSSCGTGIISVSGPYSFPSQWSIVGRTVYIVQAIQGERVFVNTSYSQRVNVSGVNSLDGADYIFYTDPPYVDYAGISMGTSTEPAFTTGTFPGFSYINWWTPEGLTMYEAINPVTADNVMQFVTSPYIEGQQLPSCDLHTVQSSIFYYCFYADMGEYEVRMAGTVVTNALNTSDGSYWATALDGVRDEMWPTGNLTSNAYDMVFQQDSIGHNNRFYQRQPFLDSRLGLTFNLITYQAPHDESRVVALVGSPPVESWGGIVNDSLHAARSPFQSWLVYQIGTVPSCPLKQERAELIQNWAFSYTVTSPEQNWLITCKGSLTVLGPFEQSLAPSQTLYIIIGASGQRTYTAIDGSQQASNIVGLANSTTTGASQMLYSPDGVDFALDALGIAFQLDSVAGWPTLPSSNIVKMTSDDGVTIEEIPFSASGPPSSAVPGTVSLGVDPSNGLLMSIPSFIVNGDEVGSVYTSQGMWVVALLSVVCAMHAVFGMQREALQLQSSVAVSRVRPVTALVLLMSAIYGICGVWAAELIFFSTAELNCTGCVYDYSLTVKRENVLLALLPGCALAVPSWWLLSSPSFIVRIREAGRGLQVRQDHRRNGDNKPSLLSQMKGKRASLTGKVAKPSLLTWVLNLLLNVVDHAVAMLQGVQRNLCWLTLVVAVPLAAGIILTRDILGLGVMAPVDVQSLIYGDVLNAVFLLLLVWVVVAMHVSGRVWRHVASVCLPLVMLLDFHIGGLTKSYTWNSSVSPSTALGDTELWMIAGPLASCSLIIYALTVAGRLRKRRLLLERQVYQAENKFQSTQKKLDVQTLFLRRLRTLYDESARILDIISVARPGASEGLVWHCLLQPEPPLQLLEQSAANCAGAQGNLSARSVSAQTNKMMASPALKYMQPAANDPNMALEGKAGLLRPDSRQHPVEDDEVGRAVEEPMDEATLALIGLLQREKRRCIAFAAASAASNTGKRKQLDPLHLDGIEPLSPDSPAIDDDSLNELPGEKISLRSSLVALTSGLPDQWTPPLSYRPSLQEVMGHPATLELFKDTMLAQRCVENVLFLCRVRRWTDPSMHRQHSMVRFLLAEQIARDFIQDKAPLQINIDATSRKAILRRIKDKQLTEGMFSAAEAEVRRLIELNNWVPFTQSDSYAFCIHLLWRNSAIIRTMQGPPIREGTDSSRILSVSEGTRTPKS